MAMSNHAIQVENLSKQYRLGQVGTGTISHDLNRFWHRIRGKEDPYLQVGEANDRTQKGSSEYVWSLRDVNFDIEKGDAVGIIGRNGAGKSTLLKILSKVTKPTTGSIRVNGRIASLLEVGTGFNPEMTGRENIYLNGAILGMRKHEIDRKLDQIVDFSGVERYLDTPVKRYSSGMYVRLAFAVAAHLESEILIVDEVLAVGDAEFQKKCLGKMGEVSKGEGRTVLFVSHNMAAISGLCSSSVLLRNGSVSFVGDVGSAIDSYFKGEPTPKDAELWRSGPFGRFQLLMINSVGEVSNQIYVGEKMSFLIRFEDFTAIKAGNIGIGINDRMNSRIVTFHTSYQLKNSHSIEKTCEFECLIDSLPLMPGEYVIEISIFQNNVTIQNDQNAAVLSVVEADFFNTGKLPDFNRQGKFLISANWKKDKIEIS